MAAGRWRRFVVRPLVWLIALAALAVLALRLVVGSSFARERARVFVVARLADALDRPVTIERLDFTLLPATLVVEGLTIAGDRPGEPPLATLRRGEIGADLAELGSRRLALRRVALHGLDLALAFREDGSDNLPRLEGSGGGRQLTVTVGGLAIDDSVVRLDHREVPLELTASAVRARLVGVGERGLDGTVAAQAVTLVLPEAQPLELAVAGRVRLEGERLEIARARVAGRGLELRADGEVRWRGGTAVDLETAVTTRGELLDELGWLRGEIAGPLELTARVAWRPDEWSVDGRLASPRAEVVDFALEEIAADVHADASGAELAIERGRWAGGSLSGRFGVRFAPGYPAELDVALSEVDLDAVLARFEVPARGVRGRLSGPLRYQFDLLDAVRGSGRGEFLIGVERIGEATLAASGEVGVGFADGVVTLDPLRWSAGGQRVAGRGEIALASGTGRLDLAVASEELGGLVAMLPFLDPAELWVPSGGTGELDVTLQLLPEGAFDAAVDFAAAAVTAPGFAAERASGAFRADADGIDIERIELVRGDGRLTIAGTVPTAEAAPLALRLAIDGWPVADAAPWLPVELPLAGLVRGEVELRGPLAALAGEADLVVAPVEVAGLPARRLAAHLDWDADRLRVAEARLDLDAGGIEGSGTFGFADESLDFRFASPALALDREPLAQLGRGALAGTLRATIELGGTLAAPKLALAAEADGATLAGAPLGDQGRVSIVADWSERRLAADVDFGGELRLAGGGTLASGESARLEFALTSPRLGRLLALATGTVVEGLEGSVEGTIAVDWPADGAPRAELRLPELAFAWRGRELRSLEPVVARLDERGVRIESFYLGAGSDDELFVGGALEFADDPRLDFHLQASLGAAWLGAVEGDFDVAGRFDALADLGGTLSRPAWSGQASWTEGRVVPPVVPHTLERASALVLIYPTSLVLDRLSGDFAGGELTASGRLQLRDGAVGSYRFEAAARDLALRWPAGWQLRGDADLTLQSTRGGRQLGGQVELDRAFYFQDLDLSPEQLVQRLLARSPVVVPETDELLASTALDVAIRAPGTLRIRNNLASLTATAELALRGSLARPVLFGDVTVADTSEVEYGGSTFRVERGVLTFANPTRIDPLLDVVASTRVQAYDVRLQLSGPLSRPMTSFSSDPPLPDLEILGLLTTGAPLDSAVLTDVRPAEAEGASSVAAEALLYGQAASLVGARVGRLFGFDRIRVEPLTARDSVSTARITVGKQLSSRLFVTYSYDPSSTAEDIVQVEWRMTDRLQLVLTQNGDESYAVDARWETRF